MTAGWNSPVQCVRDSWISRSARARPLVLDNTQLYFMEVDLDGVEMIGETSGGRWAFYPGTGSHDRSDLEARLDALEALIGPLKKSSATADAPTAAAKFRATGATARLEYGMLGVGKVAGVGSTAQAQGISSCSR